MSEALVLIHEERVVALSVTPAIVLDVKEEVSVWVLLVGEREENGVEMVSYSELWLSSCDVITGSSCSEVDSSRDAVVASTADVSLSDVTN